MQLIENKRQRIRNTQQVIAYHSGKDKAYRNIKYGGNYQRIYHRAGQIALWIFALLRCG
jgi:soluble lytic murein transglycosylase-like protein